MKLVRYIFILPFLCLAVSCAESVDQEAYGYIDIQAENDMVLDVVTVTKSESGEPVFAVKVCDTKGEVVFSTPDLSSLQEPLMLKTGDYTVYATSGEDCGPAAFDKPFYSGETDVPVRAHVISDADILCSLQSVQVTASISQDIKDNFTYSLTIGNTLSELIYDESTYGRTGYFQPTGSLEWELLLTNEKGEQFLVEEKYDDVKANQHYDLSFSLEENPDQSYGAGEFRIILDNSYNETYHVPTIWINEDGPSISGEDEYVKYVSDPSVDALCTLSSTRKFTSVRLTHSDKALLDAGLPYSAELVSDIPVEDFVASSPVSVIITAEDGTVLSGFDASARTAHFNFTELIEMLPVGTYSMALSAVNESGLSVNKDISIVVKSSIVLDKYDPWAEFIFIKGEWLSDSIPAQIKIQYKKSAESAWRDFTPSVSTQYTVDSSSKTFRAFVCGLEAQTSYHFRIVTDKEQLAHVGFTTDSADQLYNSNFEHWYQPDGKTWYPYYQNASAAERVWDSANKGTSMIGYSNTEPTSASGECVSGKAVKMTTVWVSIAGITKLAAGNVYTGRFNTVVGTTGADLDWGYAFYSRPLGFKGHYRYASKPINRTGSAHSSYNGQPDMCQIHIILHDAGQPYFIYPFTVGGVSVNGPSLDRKNYIDLNVHSSVIARGVRNYGDTGGAFKEVTLPFTYRSIDRTPTHAIVAFSSSYLGDYFTGGEGAVMWADEFEYVYDPLELDAADRDAFFELFK